jgi:maltooligosyltrehalose trehalohydrolase
MTATVRRMPMGAEVVGRGGVHFRVWAPTREKVEVVLAQSEQDQEDQPETYPLKADKKGYFAGLVPQAASGRLYRFRLDEEAELYPDPASRFQSKGVHGPSEIIDPDTFTWNDQDWPGINQNDPRGQVIYEMHIGTFTKEGTWAAASQQLEELSSIGITVLEIMPVAAFPGRFGWGYDGVDLFAPTHLYGRPDDMRQFVNQAHARRIGVILDVVYNHLGPDGNFLKEFSPYYFSAKYSSEWGESFNFDDEQAAEVREFILSNAVYWVKEFHLDGLRLDATQQIFDDSEEHIIAALARRLREAAHPRSAYIVGENEPQDVKLLHPPERGGYGLDALWNDDFHHTAKVGLTGRADAYYHDYRGRAQEFISAMKYGFLYQGQWYSWQKNSRGTPSLGLAPGRLIHFLQNHDQIANSASGRRAHFLSSPSRFRVMTAIMLLAPQTPMLFQGQEYMSSKPFFYFADQETEIALLIAKGRGEFLSQFRSLGLPEMQARLPEPDDPMTFVMCKLDHHERETHPEAYALHKDLLRLRREDTVFQHVRKTGRIDGAVFGSDAFVIRFFGETAGDDRLLLINLNRDLLISPSPEPLLAPPEQADWAILWNSEDPRYGGDSLPPWPKEGNWLLIGESAVLLYPQLKRNEPDES